MWNNTLDNKLMNIIPEERIFRDESMSRHTTFRVGGPVERYVSIGKKEELKDLIRLCNEENIPRTVIGNGSNLLVSDKGLDGICIEVGKDMRDISVRDNVITASAGVLLSILSSFARDNALTGLEFAGGIPGTVGGAMVMNAGAYGGEMKDVVSLVHAYDPKTDEYITLTADEMEFGYRKSIVRNRGLVVTEVEFTLLPGDKDVIKATMDELTIKRRQKQPLEYPSAGSTFKRPEGFFAGKLIEDSGLKGYSVGGAQVSEKHAGFVINKGGASASDIYHLILEVREKVYADTGVRLEPEVICLGDWS